MAIEKIEKYKTTDGKEHTLLADAETHQAQLNRATAERSVGNYLLAGWNHKSEDPTPKDVHMVRRLLDNFEEVGKLIPTNNLAFFDLPSKPPADFTRGDLIKVCEMAFVPASAWGDRDSAAAQEQVGQCYAFLKAGCDFKIVTEPITDKDTVSDNKTIWLKVWVKGFKYYDGFEPGDDVREYMDEHDFYLPTPQRIVETGAGKDWY